MKSRLLTAVAALALGTMPAFAQADKADGPAITIQAAPVGKILDDVKAMVRTVAGDKFVQQMDEALKEHLGDKGFEGIDLLRPPVGYVNLEKLENIENPKDLSGVAIIPVTGEKEFVAFLKRIKLDVEPVKDKDGLYRIDPRDEAAPFPVRMRFADRSAYIGFNMPDDALVIDKLVPAAKIVNPAERGLFSYTTYYSRMPKALIEQYSKQADQLGDQLKQVPLPPGAGDALGSAMKSIFKLNEQMYREGDVAVVRFAYDPPTAEIFYETTVKGKPGTTLTKEIADRKPATNRFAGLVGNTTAAGLLTQVPTFTPEVRDAIASGLEAARKSVPQQTPEEYRAVADETLAGLIRTVKSNEFDIGAAVNGPDANGLFTVVAGISFDDPSKLEKELRALYKNAPEEVRNMIKLDDAKAGDVSVHRMAVGLFLPPEAKKVFGDKASVCVAFAPKAIHLTFGPSAVEAIQGAIAAKPGPAKALELVVNPAKAQKLAAAANPQAGEVLARALGTEDSRLSLLAISVEGGTELRIRLTMALKGIPKLIATGVATERLESSKP